MTRVMDVDESRDVRIEAYEALLSISTVRRSGEA